MISPHRRQALAEIACIFAVFYIQGGWPVPDVNDPYYLGKAIHFWNPSWAPGDFFLDSADTHKVFYFTFGWLAIWLPLPVLAWCGRILTWGLLAWAWRRLSVALLPRPWFAVLTAGLLVCLNDRCHMAGEWVVGSVEAKGFAFVLVFLGLEALMRERWNRAWLLLGAAAAFHVLVGGWWAVAAGLAWLLLPSDRPTFRSMAPALLGGLLLSLPGLIPSLTLNWGVAPALVNEANQIYVFQRLPHHLAVAQFQPIFIVRFVLLLALWLVLCRWAPAEKAFRRLRAFVGGAVLIAVAGAALGLLEFCDGPLAAALLRLYWFRLSDVAVPLGVALLAVSISAAMLSLRPLAGKCCLAILLVVACVQLGGRLLQWPWPARSLENEFPQHQAWLDACTWVARSGKIAPEAKFLTPMMSQTFKWYTGRAEVVNWKEIPQDARAIVLWWQRIREIYGTGMDPPGRRWHLSLAERGPRRLNRLGREYGADYLLTIAWPRLALEVVYENPTYIIYRLTARDGGGGRNAG